MKRFRHNEGDGRGPYRLADMGSPQHGKYHYTWKGYEPPTKGWRCPETTMQKYHDEGLLHYPVDENGGPAYDRRIEKKGYLSKYKGAPIGNVWSGIPPLQESDEEFMGYSTQKPPGLMALIILCSNRPGDLVFDPFCGCASLLTAAEDLGRVWAGCDRSPKAVKLLKERIVDRKDLLRPSDISDLYKPSRRDDCKHLPNYRTHKHTLYGMQKGVCVGCGDTPRFDLFHIDHIQPKSRGGQDDIDNLQLLCGHCNSSKQGKTMAEWIAWREKNRPETYKDDMARLAQIEAEWKRVPA